MNNMLKIALLKDSKWLYKGTCPQVDMQNNHDWGTESIATKERERASLIGKIKVKN